MYIFFLWRRKGSLCACFVEKEGVLDVRMMCATVGFVGQVEAGVFSWGSWGF